MKSLIRIAALAALCCTTLMPANTVAISLSNHDNARNPQSQIQTPKSKLESPALRQALQFAETTPGSRLRVIVRLKENAASAQQRQEMLQASGGASTGPATGLSRQALAAQRQQLVQVLQESAQASRVGVQAFLSRPDIAPRVFEARFFWIFNGLALYTTPDVIHALAARDDVASIRLDEWRQWIQTDWPPAPLLPTSNRPPFSELPDTSAATVLARSPISASLSQRVLADPPGPGETTWGIAKIRADRVWRSLNITGTGVVVANIDSGVDWNHPALKSSYRGWNAGPATDHLHNWFDATNEASTYPSDLNGHGTHTMGTIVGRNGIGIAPGARWMAAKGLNGAGYGLYSWLHAAFQFMLAPAGNPAYAPDIVSNSWGSEDGLDTEFAADIAALRAAGIVALFANGNKGPAAGTVNSPASLPGAFGVGATDPDDDVAYFSSRGPSPFGEVRPHLSAPGVGVLSTFPGGSHATASGTSMATPHAAGAAALVLSANPSLSVFSVTHALTSTAVPLSTTLPNNASGWGRVDAWNAVLSVVSTGVITGRVLDGAQPISGALVVAHSGPIQAQAFSEANGYYAIPAVAGIYTVTASAFGYQPATSTPRIVITNSVTTVNFNLSALPSGIARGVVTDVASGAYLTQTVVRALGTPESSLANGGSPARYYALNLPAGVYTIEARLPGYIVQTRTVLISDGVISELNFALTPTQRIAFVDSGAWYYGSAARQYKQALDDLALAYDELRVKRLPVDTPTITQLLRYDTVIWSAPFDSPEYIGAGDVISRYLASGRNLLLSGQDVAFYDGGGFLFHPYFNRLNAYYLSDDVPSRVITGAQQSLLAGKVLTIAGGDGADNQYLVDAVRVVNPDHGRGLGIYRAGGPALETAGVYAEQCLTYRSAYFAFGLEAIDSAADRADTLRRVLNAFDAPRPTAGVELLSRDAYHTTTPVGPPGSVITHLARIRHTGEAGLTDTFTLTLSGNQWPAIISPAVVELAPCSSTLALITVTIPLSATWDAQDTVTVTAVSHISPSATSVISFSSKTPAGILLVDDDRFYNREQDYLEALAAQGNRADRWDTRWGFGIADSPPITLLRLYPLVIWFNGYDWFDPIQLAEQDILQQYLDEGGRLFFSSQAALFQTELSPFNRHYLGVAAIDFEDTFSRVVGVPGHVIGAGFANSSLLNELNQFPYAWNLSTAVQPLTGTQVILRGDSGQPAGLARAGASTSSATSSADWRTVFMPFAFEALTTTAKADLMNRAAGWLSWLGASSLFPHEDQIAAGDTVTFTIALRADDVISPALAITPTVTISAPVAEHLFVVSSTLTGWSDHHAGEWSGALQAGMALTWTFVATTSASLSAGEMLTAWLRVNISQPDLAFTRYTATRVGGPRVISSLTVAPASPQWGGLITATARMTNVGSIAAPGARMTSVVPIALSLLTPTVHGPSIGSVTVSRNRIDWAGALAPGAAITLTYQMSAPAFGGPQRDFYHAVLVDDGSGALSQSARWISPGGQNRFLPLVLR